MLYIMICLIVFVAMRCVYLVYAHTPEAKEMWLFLKTIFFIKKGK